ncbi:MAG: hypothetical protein AVDCRST_MAG56-2863 [uncultured Cytophagales bacterium]|uniref:Uncharacterized protein n=1 Tax=uncultured Cytophagales bacterium TaxID=158755 RepID=A0A6J4IYS5_9SPHI|nr:MAG: hypothetical protein AVDCRST_MAG56-2863 [uncultured Cytophagales bacterium]
MVNVGEWVYAPLLGKGGAVTRQPGNFGAPGCGPPYRIAGGFGRLGVRLRGGSSNGNDFFRFYPGTGILGVDALLYILGQFPEPFRNIPP